MKPRFNEPLYNEVLGITNDIFQVSNGVMYRKKNLDITNQFSQSLGTSSNRGSTVSMKSFYCLSVIITHLSSLPGGGGSFTQ